MAPVHPILFDMKHILPLFALLALPLLLLAQKNHNLNEGYARKQLCPPTVGAYSQFELETLVYTDVNDKRGYLEIAACKSGGKKWLIFGADDAYYLEKFIDTDPVRISADDHAFAALDTVQARSLIRSLDSLQAMADHDKPKGSRTIQHTFAVTTALHCSIGKGDGTSGTSYVDLWIDGRRFRYNVKDLKRAVEEFMAF